LTGLNYREAATTNEKALFYQISADEYIKIIDINIKELVLSTYVAYNRMLLQGYGAIYNMKVSEVMGK